MARVAPAGTFRFLLDQRRSAYWMRGRLGQGRWGILCGLIFDEAIEAWTLCLLMAMLADKQSPDDVLPIVARDRRLDRYHLESAAQHRQRLIDAWDIYAYAGTEHVIEQQLAAAGYPGAFVEFRPSEKGPRGEAPPYRTQFWVVFPANSHPVTGPPKPWGTFIWGQTWLDTPGVWAPMGLTAEFYRTVLGIVLKWKPSTYVFRGFTFQLSVGGPIDMPVALGARAP